MRVPDPSPNEAARFVGALLGVDFREAAIVLQLFDDDDARRKTGASRQDLLRVLQGPLPKLWTTAIALNQRGSGVFVQVNAGTRGARNVTGLRALFIDDDGGHWIKQDDGKKNFEASPTPKLKLPPSCIVERGGNFRKRHYYWFLKSGEPIDKFSEAQRHLAAYYQTDKSVINPDRVMRLPGTIHWKDASAPQAVKIAFIDGKRRYTIDEVLAAHPLEKPLEPELDPSASAPQAEISPAAKNTAKKIQRWLDRQEIAYRIIGDGLEFRLQRCPNNPEHRDAYIRAMSPSGAIFAGCFHDSCGGNAQRWWQFKEAIGGWDPPRWGFARGDHTELVKRLLSDAGAGSTQPIVFADGQFYRYSAVTGIWEAVTDDELSQLLLTYGGLPKGRNEAVLVLKNADRRGVIDWAGKVAARPEFFQAAPCGVAFQNGFLTFGPPEQDREAPAPIEFKAHQPENRARAVLRYQYDPSLGAPRWLKFLRECFAPDDDREQKIAVLQEFIGACLLGEAWRYQTALVLFGPRAENGKSVFIDTISELFPRGLRQTVKPQDFGHEYTRAMLVGVHLNAVNEIPESEILNADSFKEVIDGKVILARHPYGRPFNFAPRAGHLFSANKLPGTQDYTRAFFRRLRVVPWNRVFTPAERDRYLTETLVRDELPAIAAWAVQGAIRLRQTGEYTLPPSSRAALDAWRRDIDPVAAFVHECTETAGLEDEGVPADVLLSTMREWIVSHGHKSISTPTAARRLENIGIYPASVGSKTVYPLRLKINPSIWN